MITLQKDNKGFTLIELLVVIAIIGLLSTLAIVALGNARLKARNAKRKADIKQASLALEIYTGDFGGYPAGEDDTGPAGQQIDMSNSGSFIPELINEGYLRGPIEDPGNMVYWYVYQNNNPNNITIREGACGAGPPAAKAALIFWLEGGVSSDYKIWYGSFGNPIANAICFYE